MAVEPANPNNDEILGISPFISVIGFVTVVGLYISYFLSPFQPTVLQISGPYVSSPYFYLEKAFRRTNSFNVAVYR